MHEPNTEMECENDLKKYKRLLTKEYTKKYIICILEKFLTKYATNNLLHKCENLTTNNLKT